MTAGSSFSSLICFLRKSKLFDQKLTIFLKTFYLSKSQNKKGIQKKKRGKKQSIQLIQAWNFSHFGLWHGMSMTSFKLKFATIYINVSLVSQITSALRTI